MIHLQDIEMQFGTDPVTIVLNKVTLSVEKNDWMNVFGASGSGKTTLLNIIGGLLKPTEGIVQIDQVHLNELDMKKLQAYRRNKIGFIYQDFKLFNQYTVLENVMVPQLPYEDRKKLENRAMHLLEEVGLSYRVHHFPSELSGGEKQRAPIARALLNNPDILLCDEPTGNLDSKNTENIMQLLQTFHERGITILLVTHDEKLVSYSNRLITIQDGQIKKFVAHESTFKEKSN